MLAVFYGFVFLALAGLVHLTSLVAVPLLADDDAYARLAAIATENRMRVLSPPEAAGLADAEPAVSLAVCRYSLALGPLRLAAPVGDAFLSATFLEPGTRVYHGLTDRAAFGGTIEVVVATAEQMARISALDSEDDLVQELRVTAPGENGLVILKALSPFPSQQGESEALLKRANCEIEALPE